VPSARELDRRSKDHLATARGRKLLPNISRKGELAEDVRL
jgi:hypothetical protein